MKPRILFVDDCAYLLESIRRMLGDAREQWDMEFFDSSRLAAEALQARTFDVVVADQSMPGLNGTDLLQEAKAHRPATACFLLSGDAPDLAGGAVAAGPFQWIAKPCGAALLRQRIAQALTNRNQEG